MAASPDHEALTPGAPVTGPADRSSRIGSLPAGLMVVVALLVVAPRAQAAADQFTDAATLTNASGAVGDYTGGSVAVSADGSTIVVGVPHANSGQGEAYVYTRGSNGWQTANEPAVLTASNGAAGYEFGYSVSVSQDGSVVAVGAPDAAGGGAERGQVYVFNRPVGGWAAQSTQNETTKAAGPANSDFLGEAVALSPDGTYLAAGLPGYSSSATSQGGVYVWSYNGSALEHRGHRATGGRRRRRRRRPRRVGRDAERRPDLRGGADAHRRRGHLRLLVTEQRRGRLHALGSRVGGRVQRLRQQPVRILGGGGGGVVAAGAPDTASDAGSRGPVRAHVPLRELRGSAAASTRPASQRPAATLTYASGNGHLGESVAMPGDGAAVLAGAPGYVASPPEPDGKAYVFQEPGAGWADSTTAGATLQPLAGAAGDAFGDAVSASSDGGALAVGDPSGNSSIGEADAFQGIAATNVGCQPGTVGVGQQTTCTATITDAGIGAATPTGTVGFTTDSSGGFNSPSCTLSSTVTGASSCQVTYTATAADSGTHTITAAYSGDDEHGPASEQTTVAINRLTTITAVSCIPSPVAVGATARCTATVTASEASDGSTDRGRQLRHQRPGKLQRRRLHVAGRIGSFRRAASFTYTASAIGPGTHQLTADYTGDGAHAASQGSEPLGVAEDSTRAAVSCSPLSVAVGQPATMPGDRDRRGRRPARRPAR